jgi:16S rRNA (uracil1498-N3)-methyltransferase
MPQHYLPQGPSGGRFRLEGDEARHLAKAVRAREGDELRLFDGAGRRWVGRIERVRAAAVEGAVLAELPETPPARELHLYLAMVQRQRFEDALEKCVELGVASVRPVFAERGEVRLKGGRAEEKLGRWRELALAACKQSGRARLPELRAPVPFLEALRDGPGLMGWVGEKSRTLLEAAEALPPGPLRLYIGPEGGFTPAEAGAGLGAGLVHCSLGPNVLRVETAAVAAVSLLLLS